MNVVVTFALRSELSPWLRLRAFHPITKDGCFLYETTIARMEVLAVLTGIGAGHAKEAIRLALGSRPDAIVASGLAGALKPSYGVGDVLVARLVRSHDGGQEVSSSDELLSLAVECGANAVASFLSVNAIARTVEEKAQFGGFADAVDMESFAIMTEAHRAGVPAIALRSVADTAGCDLPCDFNKMVDERGRLRMWRVALERVCAPQSLPALVRFAVASHRAAVRLARFLDAYLEVVGKSQWKSAMEHVSGSRSPLSRL